MHNLLAAFRQRGHDVKILSTVDVRDFWRGRLPAKRLVSEALAIRRESKRFLPDAWFVYCPSMTYPDLFGWWQRPKRYILFAADIGREEGLPKRWRWLYAFAHRRSLRRADAAIVQRPKSVAHLRFAGVAPERIHLIPAPPRTWEELPEREDARRRLGLPRDKPVILCMGRFPAQEKNKAGKTEMVLALLTAFAPLSRDIVLVIVGDDGPGYKQVEDRVAKLELNGRVRLIGPEERVRLVGSRDNADVKWFYAACDFYAYPHTLDRPWLSVLEAQACGRPVVTMRTQSTETIVDSERTGLLANDLAEFQKHIAALAGDRARCEAMGRAACDYVAKFHSMDVRIRQIEELLGCGGGHEPANRNRS